MRTVRRLRLRCFSFYDYRCRAVHSVTLCPVETMQAHHKNISPRIIAIHINRVFVSLGVPSSLACNPLDHLRKKKITAITNTTPTYEMLFIIYKYFFENRITVSINSVDKHA